MDMKSRTASNLRERHAEQTREIILDALVDQLGEEGPFEFSYFELARRAKVSVRTLYRYFPTREALFAALGARMSRALGEPGYPTTADGVASTIARLFRAFDREEKLVRANITGALGREVRVHARRDRVAALAEVVASAMPEFSPEERAPYVAVVASLANAEHWLRAREELDVDGARCGEATAWALRVLFHAMSELNPRRIP
jgi:AcrR family transcriptional regulator